MLSTIVYTQTGRMNMSETLRQTAIAMTEKKGSFHINDILFGLKSQGIETITAKQVANLLWYDGSGYKGRTHTQKRIFHRLLKLQAGWYTWEKMEYNPNPDETKGEVAFSVL